MAVVDKIIGSCIFLSITLLACSIVTVSSNPYMVEPFNVEAIVGKPVTIYCQVKPGEIGTNVYWSLPGNMGALGPNTNENTAFDRFSFTGDQVRGYYNLEIRDVQENDGGTYTCIYTDGVSFTYEREAQLDVVNNEVLTTPECDAPASLQVDDVTVFRNITCSADGGVPLAGGTPVQWRLQLKDNSVMDIPAELIIDQSTNISVISNIRNYKLTGREDYSQLICSTADKRDICTIPQDHQARFRVLYQPLVSYIPSEIEVGMFEAYDLDIRCIADGYPSLDAYPMFQFSEGIQCNGNSTIGNDLVVPNRRFITCTISISMADVDKEINCTASNAIGSTTTTIKIQSLAGLTPWLICIIIFVCGFILFLLVVFFACCCCGCDLAHERTKTERKRKTIRERKGVTNGGNTTGDDFDDVNIEEFGHPDGMMMPAESPHDSGNDPGSHEGSTNDAMVNDYKVEEAVDDFQIEEPDYDVPPKEFDQILIVNRMDDDQDDQDGDNFDDYDEDPPKADYLRVSINDDTDGEEMELTDIIRDPSPIQDDDL